MFIDIFAAANIFPDLKACSACRRGLSLADRRKVLEKLRASDREQSRNIHAAFVTVSAATYYASELTWPDLGYPGVSVDHPEILNRQPPIPWRPGDPRPIEP